MSAGLWDPPATVATRAVGDWRIALSVAIQRVSGYSPVPTHCAVLRPLKIVHVARAVLFATAAAPIQLVIPRHRAVSGRWCAAVGRARGSGGVATLICYSRLSIAVLTANTRSISVTAVSSSPRS